MSTPHISVIIDAYNYGRYVEEAVESVLAQGVPEEEREILVVDDGSTDDTRERVSKYAGRVQYLWKENGGQASAFNFGFAHARGELIFLLDADDYWRAGKLQHVARLFSEHPDVGMVYHRYQECDEQSGKIAELAAPLISGKLAQSKIDLISYWIYPTSTLAFRRTALDAVLPVPEGLRIQADAYLAALVVFLAPVLAIPEPLTVYRVHASNLFHTGRSVAGSARERTGTERRMATRQVFIEEVRRWLAQSGRDVAAEPVRSYLAQWTLAQEADEFRLRAPGRVRGFWHLLQYPRYFAERMSWRHQAAAYLEAAGALCLGYRRREVVANLRHAVKRAASGIAAALGSGSTRGVIQNASASEVRGGTLAK